MRKPAFCICENKDADQLRVSFAVTEKLISAFVFATRIVQSLFFVNTKFPASSHLLWLYSLVCLGPGRKPQDRFSHNEAQIRSLSVYLVLCFEVDIVLELLMHVYCKVAFDWLL